MAAPLYVDLNMPKTCQGHYGLWFERFFDQYIPQKWEVSDHKAVWLRDFNHKVVGDRNQLEVYSQSQYTLCQALNGQQQVFKASWHFVTGMGNPHPVENGFAWHPTLGVPYLTGAAVKGIIRAYIDNYPYLEPNEPNEPLKKELLLNWFGSTSKDPTDTDYKAQGGALIFFDAIPIQPVTLGVDIMTPHMGKWYADGAKNPNQPETVPADWHDPVPVSFLVANDITLLFSFALRPTAWDAEKQGEQAKDKIDLTDVAYVLEQALLYAGAGAKTATGYGAFETLPEELCVWVDETIKSLAEKNRVPEHKWDDVLFGKNLADAWQALTNADLKQQALSDIKARWQAKGIWDDPQGKARKQAKAIYEG